MDKIKKYFKNKKTDAAFKRAGPGYRLDETPSRSAHKVKESSSTAYQPVPGRSGLTEESQQAAAAALARLDKQKTSNTSNRAMEAVRAKVRQEMEAEKAEKKAYARYKTVQEQELDSAPLLAVQGVYFQCPLLGPEILSKEEWNQKIREFLYEQVKEEKGLVACLIIRTLNGNREKIEACIETIKKYFKNILKNPTDEKYRKIRMSNEVFQEKVKPIEGALLLLEAAGFESKELPHQDAKEQFLVFPEEKVGDASEVFDVLLDGLESAEPITLELYRNPQVLLPAQVRERNELPSSFYNITVEDLKKQQMMRTETAEQYQMLRTSAMRARDEIQEIRKYKYALIRIRFPDEIFLQGTFGVYEKVSSIIEFVKSSLNDENLSFNLMSPNGQQLVKFPDSSLVEMKLVPAVVLIFNPEGSREAYLKPEVLETLTVICQE